MKRIQPPKNKNFCIVPWTHTYLSPLSERRLCCASREHSTFVQQYIDLPGQHGTNYRPSTISEHWNSEHMRSVRRRMLAGETLPECQVCNENILSLSTYRHWFTYELFPQYIANAFEKTDDSGYTSMPPISFDYRFSNACNFKCRMCGEQFSSSWESENKTFGDFNPLRDPWLEPSTRQKIRHFQETVAEAEFAQAVEEKRIEEIYWVGGEPLVWDQHWKYMQRIIELGYADKVYVRYNTNLSITERNGVSLFHDLLPHFKGYMISASIDGAGAIGEFVRSGLHWEKWLKNFTEGVAASRGRPDNSMLMDITLTLPGLFSIKELFDHALRLGVRTEVKLTYAFDPFVILSPMAPPRKALDSLLSEIISHINPRHSDFTRPLLHTLQDMKKRPTFVEQFPDTWREGFYAGRNYLQKIAARRNDGKDSSLTFDSIYSANPLILDWWRQ